MLYQVGMVNSESFFIKEVPSEESQDLCHRKDQSPYSGLQGCDLIDKLKAVAKKTTSQVVPGVGQEKITSINQVIQKFKQSPANLSSLPLELLVMTFDYLTISELMKILTTNKTFCIAINSICLKRAREYGYHEIESTHTKTLNFLRSFMHALQKINLEMESEKKSMSGSKIVSKKVSPEEILLEFKGYGSCKLHKLFSIKKIFLIDSIHLIINFFKLNAQQGKISFEDNNCVIKECNMAVSMSVQHNQPELLDLLLVHCIHLESIQGLSAMLFMTIWWNSIDVVKVLLKYVKVDVLNEEGESLLFYAAKVGNPKIVKLLLEKGINPNFLCAENATALQIAIEKANPFILDKVQFLQQMEVIDLLIKSGAREEFYGRKNWHSLAYSIHSSNLELVKLFLTKVQYKDSPDSNRNTCLHLACSTRIINQESEEVMVRIAEELLKRKANVDAIGEHHSTPLALAIIGGRIKMIELLVKYNADPNIPNQDGNTALHLVLLLARIFSRGPLRLEELVFLLLKNQADPNIRNHKDLTPLELAIKFNYKGVVRLLCRLGADIFLSNAVGKSAISQVVENGNSKIALLFLKNLPIKYPFNGQQQILFYLAVKARNLVVVKEMLNGDMRNQHNGELIELKEF